MKRSLRITGYVLIGVLVALVLLVGVFLLLTRTDYGLERVRDFAVDRIEDRMEGDLRVERITTPGVLGRATLHRVAIDDPEGRPFLRVDSALLVYDWRTLLGGQFVFERLEVHNAEAYVTRLPGDTAWNYEYIFPDTTPEDEPDDLILFERAIVRNSLVEVRYPWEPDERPVAPEDTARLILEPAGGGIVRVLRFAEIDGDFPRVLWSTPAEEGSLFRVAELSTRGYIWERPFHLTDLEGTVTVRDSLIAFETPVVRLPSSRASAVGRVITEDDEPSYDIRIEGSDVAFADLQWLYPPLPEEGGGNLIFRINTLAPERTLWLAEDAYLHTPGTEIAGDFGIVTGDTLYFTRVDLRASPLDVDLIEQLIPADLPIEGLMVGTVEVEGPLSALETRGDVRLVGGGADGGTAEMSWEGVVDVRRRMPRRLTADVRRVDAALLASLHPGFRTAGTWSGRIEVGDPGGRDGSFSLAASIRNVLDESTTTDFEVDGLVVRPGRGSPALDLTLRTPALALRALRPFVPGTEGLEGAVHGELRVTGPADDIRVDGGLDTPGGPLELHGRLDLARGPPSYRIEGRFDDYDPARFAGRGPPMSIRGRFELAGTGIDPRRARADLELTIDTARIGDVEIEAALARIAVEDGLARIDTLGVRAPMGRLTARGDFGLVPDRTGRVDVDLRADSLGAFRTMVFADTVLADGDEEEEADPRTLAGTAEVHGSIHGNIGAFDADAELTVRRFAYRAFRVGRAVGMIDVRRAGTDDARLRLRLTADTAAFDGRVLDAARAEAMLTASRGSVAVAASGPEDRTYGFAADYARAADTTVVSIEELRIGSREAAWTIERPVTVRLEPTTAEFTEARLVRSDGSGRVTVEGRLPFTTDGEHRRVRTDQPVEFRVAAEGIRIGHVLRLAQSEAAAGGTLRGRLSVTGTAGAPRFVGDAVVDGMRFDSLSVSRVSMDFSYGDRRLETRIAATQADRRILDGRGSVPLDLALLPVADRRLDEPLDFAFQADRVPAALLASLVPGFYALEGELDGEISIGGTARDPVLGGSLALRDAAATWAVSGVQYREIEGNVRVLSDRVVGVEVRARAGRGDATITGSITVGSLDDPAFDLLLRMRDFPAVQRPEVDGVASGEIRLGGHYRSPEVTGRVEVNRGALYLDRIVRNRRIVELQDPLLEEVLDTARVAVDDLVPAAERNPFLANLVLSDATVAVSRDFWLRGRNMNVELVGNVNVTYDRGKEDLRLAGVLNAVRGTYQLRVSDVYSRRFTVREGTVEFVGTPGMDPDLDLTGQYRVRTASGDPLDILVRVAGTLREPRVRLTSDSEPPISESELVSYLIFGRPTFALGPGESRAIDQLGLNLVSEAGLTVLSPLTSELENALGLDYLSISRADPARGTAGSSGGWLDPFEDLRAEVEVGWYPDANPDLFVALSGRIGRSRTGGQSTLSPLPGVRVEWRFRPTWMLEFFVEDRFARVPTFGADAILEARDAAGFFLAREWGF